MIYIKNVFNETKPHEKSLSLLQIICQNFVYFFICVKKLYFCIVFKTERYEVY